MAPPDVVAGPVELSEGDPPDEQYISILDVASCVIRCL
jgi:hypothetical protein